jgi:F-type H+-transporting ATPase subunit b
MKLTTTARFTNLAAAAIALVLALPAWAMPLAAQTAAPAKQAEPHAAAPATESVKPHGESKEAEIQAGHEGGEKTAEKAEKKQDATEALTESLRHSSAVKAIGRLTGLDAEKAYWLSTVLNFLIVGVVLWVLLRKVLPGIFRDRTASIQKRLDEARKTSEEARQRLAGVEERLARLDSEIAQMRTEAETAGKADEERVMKAAEDERRRIVEAARQEIATAASSAQRELKAFVADLAVGMAEKKISVGQAADQTIVREFTAGLGKEQ